MKILADFQICISVPLGTLIRVNVKWVPRLTKIKLN